MAEVKKRTLRTKLETNLALPSTVTLETWRANATDIQVAIYDADGVAAITDIQSVNCKVQPSQLDDTTLMDSTVAAASMDADLTDAEWLAGTDQHATFSFTNSETNLTLTLPSLNCWIVFTATLTGGEEVTLAAGTLTIHEDNNAAGDPPAANPGTAITIEEADARYLQSMDWEIKTDDFTAVNGGRYVLNNAAKAFMITLPDDVPAHTFEIVVAQWSSGSLIGGTTSGTLTSSTSNVITYNAAGAWVIRSVHIPDVYSRSNHTGTQLLSTISDAGTAAAVDVEDLPVSEAQQTAINGFSSDVNTLLSSHDTANANITNPALISWGLCLAELETGGILDELVDGACHRIGFNLNTSYLSIKNVAGTITGTVAQSPDGAVFSDDSANRLQWTVDTTSAYTLAADFRIAEDAPVDLTTVACIAAVGGTAVSGAMLTTPGGIGKIYNADGGAAAYTAQIGNVESTFNVHIYNPNDTMCAWSTDNAATPEFKVYVNGHPEVTDSTGNHQTSTGLTKLTIGAQHATDASYLYPMVGTVASWLLFSRVLTDAENVTVAKALRHLDPRKKNIITWGDSRTCQHSNATNRTSNWPYIYATSPTMARNARLFNVANNGWTAESAKTDWDVRTAHLAPNGTSILQADQYIWFGANDWQAAYTAVQCLADVVEMANKGRALGMRNIVLTDPEGGTTYTSGEEAERVAYNAALITDPQNYDSLIDLDSALGTYRDIRWWYDEVHFSNDGNEQLAHWLLMGGIKDFPKRVNNATLDLDATRTSTTTLTDVALTGTTDEGLSVLGFALAANEAVSFEAILNIEDAANPKNVKVGISKPAGCSSVLHGFGGSHDATAIYSYGGTSAVVNLLGSGSAGMILHLKGWVKNGTTAGNITVQFAQFSSTATTITLKSGSSLSINR